jgi:hypothetical protein
MKRKRILLRHELRPPRRGLGQRPPLLGWRWRIAMMAPSSLNHLNLDNLQPKNAIIAKTEENQTCK